MLSNEADLALVVGGYNSSNTSHLVELCETELTTYHIADVTEIHETNEINHYKFRTKEFCKTPNFIPQKDKIKVLLSSGASCPDAVVEKVMDKVASLVLGEDFTENKNEVLKKFQA